MKFWNGPNIIGTLDVSSHVHFPGLVSQNEDHVVVIDTATGKLHYKQLKTGPTGIGPILDNHGHVPITHGGTGQTAVGNEGDILTTKAGQITWISGNVTRDWSVDQGLSNINPGNYSNDNTQLSEEQVADFVGGMLGGSQTEMTVGYDDEQGNLTFALDLAEETKKEEKASSIEVLAGTDDVKAITALKLKEAIEAKKVHELTAPTADFDMSSQKITNLATPTSSNDAARKQYVDDTVASNFTTSDRLRVRTTNAPMLIGSGIGYVPSPVANRYYHGNNTYGWNHHSWAGVFEDEDRYGTTFADEAPTADKALTISEDKQNIGHMIPVDLSSATWKVMFRGTNVPGSSETILAYMMVADRVNASNSNTNWVIIGTQEVAWDSGVWCAVDITYTGTITTDKILALGFGVKSTNSPLDTQAIKMSHQLYGIKK